MTRPTIVTLLPSNLTSFQLSPTKVLDNLVCVWLIKKQTLKYVLDMYYEKTMQDINTKKLSVYGLGLGYRGHQYINKCLSMYKIYEFNSTRTALCIYNVNSVKLLPAKISTLPRNKPGVSSFSCIVISMSFSIPIQKLICKQRNNCRYFFF